MAFKLTKEETGTFTGKEGETVHIGVESDAPASTVHIIYGGDLDGEAPFEFTIKPGRKKLLIAAVGAKNSQKMRVIEIDGDETRVLKKFIWSSNHFHTTLNIEGV